MNWESINTEQMVDFMATHCPKSILADGLNDCIVGVLIIKPKTTNVLYSTHKIVRKLMKRDGMSYLDAVEFFDFNIKGAMFDESITPKYINDLPNPNLN